MTRTRIAGWSQGAGLLLLLAQAGCAEEPASMTPTSEADTLAPIGGGSGDSIDAATEPTAPMVIASDASAAMLDDAGAEVDCFSPTGAAYNILSNRCYVCHISDSRGHGGFGGVLSAASMIRTGHVVPYAPERSPVYLRVESGDMPRVGARLTPTEVASIEAWIRCGAPLFERELRGMPDAGAFVPDAGVEML